jgi:ribosome recycling factor
MEDIMLEKQILLAGEEPMKRTLEKLKSDFSGVRTGRASTALIEDIRVDSYGSVMPMKQVANIGTSDARTIEIRPWDVSQIGAIEKAILKSDIGLTPVNDGKIIRLSVPPLTEERRKELIKFVSKMSEEFRVAIRNERRHILEQLKKAEKDKKLTEDERKKGEAELQKLTDMYIKKIDESLAQKEKEIMIV